MLIIILFNNSVSKLEICEDYYNKLPLKSETIVPGRLFKICHDQYCCNTCISEILCISSFFNVLFTEKKLMKL